MCRLAVLAAVLGCFTACRSAEAPPTPAGSSSPPARGGELVASIRSEPPTYNRYVTAGAVAATDVVTFLTQARLVRVNRSTDDLEPWLAEGWTSSPDGLTYTITLKPGIQFSDGVPLTSADVLFSFRAAYDPAVASHLGPALSIHGEPLAVSAPDARTVVVRFPETYPAGLRLLDNLPILPRHTLEPLLAAGQFQSAWSASKPVTDIVGLGPFQLVEHVAGQRLVFTRNPRYFRRDAAGVQLPYLDRLTLVIVPDQNTEALRLEAAESDLMSNGDIRPQDYAAFKRLADQGRLRMIEVSVALDADFLSFNLRPSRLGARPDAVAGAQGVPPGRVLRRRSRGDRQHGVPRRGGSLLRTGHARQPPLVLGRHAGVSGGDGRSRSRPAAARDRRPDRPQRRRHARGRGRDRRRDSRS